MAINCIKPQGILGIKQALNHGLKQGSNKAVRPKSLDNLTFQGNFKKHGKKVGLLSAMMLALGLVTGCTSSEQSKPQPNVQSSSQWHKLGYGASVKVITIEGHKVMLVDGFEAVGSAPFPPDNNNNSGLTYESAWADQGYGASVKVIEYDGERFMVTDGFQAVEVVHLPKKQVDPTFKEPISEQEQAEAQVLTK